MPTGEEKDPTDWDQKGRNGSQTLIAQGMCSGTAEEVKKCAEPIQEQFAVHWGRSLNICYNRSLICFALLRLPSLERRTLKENQEREWRCEWVAASCSENLPTLQPWEAILTVCISVRGLSIMSKCVTFPNESYLYRISKGRGFIHQCPLLHIHILGDTSLHFI